MVEKVAPPVRSSTEQFKKGQCPKSKGTIHQVVGWDDGANRASNDAAVSIVPPKMPDCGFSLGTALKLACQTGPSLIARQLSLLPAYPSRGTSLPPSFVLSAAA